MVNRDEPDRRKEMDLLISFNPIAIQFRRIILPGFRIGVFNSFLILTPGKREQSL